MYALINYTCKEPRTTSNLPISTEMFEFSPSHYKLYSRCFSGGAEVLRQKIKSWERRTFLAKADASVKLIPWRAKSVHPLCFV